MKVKPGKSRCPNSGVSCGRTRCRKINTTPVLAHLSEDDRKAGANARLPISAKSWIKRTIGPRGRQALAHLMPHLLSDVCAREDAAVTLSRITALLVGIVTRTTDSRIAQ